MNRNLFAILAICMFGGACHAAHSVGLTISGVVPDRGFVMNSSGTQLSPQLNSEMKVYVSGTELKSSVTVSKVSLVTVVAP